MAHPFFSFVNYSSISVYEISKDLELILEWSWKWKTSFNRDKNKQAQEVVFLRKLSKPKYPQLLLIKVRIVFHSSQKHVFIVLDQKLSFTHHIEVEYRKKVLELMLLKV